MTFNARIPGAFLAVPLMVSGAPCPRLDLQIDSIVDIMVEGIGR